MQETITVFNKTLSKTHVWLKELAEFGNFENLEMAYIALRAVLQTLRDQLSVDEAAHFAAQLPMLVRGFYYEGWNPPHHPKPSREITVFNSYVGMRLSAGNTNIEPVIATQAVFKLLKHKLSKGDIQHIFASLPKQFKAFLTEMAIE